MNHWPLKKLGDESILMMTSGGTPSRSKSEFYGGKILWLKSGELNDNQKISDSEEKITDQAVKNSSAKLFPPHTVLFAMYGATAGKLGILDVEATTNQAVAGMICNDSVLFYKYLFYFLLYTREKIIANAWGGAQPNLSQTIIKKFEIPVPSISEQKKIVTKLESLLAKENQVKQLREQTQVDTDSLIFAELHKIFKEGKAKGWEEKDLGNVLEKIVGGGTPSKANPLYWDGDIPWASVKDIKEGQYTLAETQDFITKEGLQNSASNIVPAGSLIISTRMGLGRIVKTEIDVAINQDLKALYPKKELNNDYLLWFYISKAQEVIASGTGATVSGVRLDDIKSIKILLPSLTDQKKIVDHLTLLLEKIKNTKSLQDVTYSEIGILEQSILSKAFSGSFV
ncbi:restriction endonuclease subunit S [Candidatus Parcubacteria bacterium]|nr:MAG: restriction endonuclease subunit S [Candidatus Parcubacteria bacterium]